MRAIILLATGALLAWPALAADFAPLSLICTGSGSATKETVTTGTFSSGKDTSTGQVIGETQQPFSDQVRVEISSTSSARMMVPRPMLPGLHGGKDGWFDIKNLSLSDTEIKGSVNLGFMSSPKIRIDRLTGMLKIDGNAGTFAGSCDPYDPANVKKKF